MRLRAGASMPIDPDSDDHGPDCVCAWCDPDHETEVLAYETEVPVRFVLDTTGEA